MSALIRFGAPHDAGGGFLRQCRQRVGAQELDSLRDEGGFSPPNTFPIEALTRPLVSEAFPADRHYEYLWALYESGLDALWRCAPWARVYLSALYVYCNKLKIWGTTVECDYYHALLETARRAPSEVPPPVLLAFVEWLHDHVPPDEGYDDYFCLLSWTFLRRMTGVVDDERFREVMANLLARRYSQERLSELTVSDRWPEDWLELNREVPSGRKGLEQETESLIRGL